MRVGRYREKEKKWWAERGRGACGACEGGWKGARGEKGEKEKKKGGRISGDDRFLVPRYSYARVPSYLRGPRIYIYIYKYMYIRNLHDTPSTIVHSRASLVITTFDYTM